MPAMVPDTSSVGLPFSVTTPMRGAIPQMQQQIIEMNTREQPAHKTADDPGQYERNEQR